MASIDKYSNWSNDTNTKTYVNVNNHDGEKSYHPDNCVEWGGFQGWYKIFELHKHAFESNNNNWRENTEGKWLEEGGDPHHDDEEQ